MTGLRAHLEERAGELIDCAALEVQEHDGWLSRRLRPFNSRAAVVLLCVSVGHDVGWVQLDDRACVPAELSGGPVEDTKAIDAFVAVAVDGRATAFHSQGGGCLEERDAVGGVKRTWKNALPILGWRRRWPRTEYEPYR